MHPYLSSGWNRTSAYPKLGFDDYIFLDDFEYDDSDLIRSYMSDMCAYENLIDHIESAPSGQKTFTFLVTMQNHGGYSESFSNFPITEYVTDLDDGWEKHQRHSGDLTPRPFTVVRLCDRQMGVGGVHSWGTWPLNDYQMPYENREFTFVIAPHTK